LKYGGGGGGGGFGKLLLKFGEDYVRKELEDQGAQQTKQQNWKLAEEVRKAK